MKISVLGSGQIGTDLTIKISKFRNFEIVLVAGRRVGSTGLKIASSMNIPTATKGIDSVLELENVDVVIDCTTASDHLNHWNLLKNRNIHVIDMTPAKIGDTFVPNVLELKDRSDSGYYNLNMVTCGGQSAAPLVYKVSQIAKPNRVEIASNIASLSAGPATRANIDEYITTTENVLSEVSGAQFTKAILVLNPAIPPITMQTTIFMDFDQELNDYRDKFEAAIDAALREMQSYVPGVRLLMKPVLASSRLTLTLQVKGNGDFLPPYSGNLDIINAAAIRALSTLESYEMKRII